MVIRWAGHRRSPRRPLGHGRFVGPRPVRRACPPAGINSAGEIADEVERDLWGPTGLPDRVQGSGGCDVGDVVTGGMCDRAVLAPSGHASDRSIGVGAAGMVRVRSRDVRPPRAESFEQDIGMLDHQQPRLRAAGFREIDRDRAFSARLSRSSAHGTSCMPPPPGRSIRTTSAPRSASSIPQKGPGPIPAIS